MGLRASVVAVSLSLAAGAAYPADRGEAKGTFAGKSVSIDYGRPTLQGRDMLGQAQVGAPWRMGADSPTMLKTAAELTFSPSVVVPPGEYVLTATKIDPEKWRVDVKRATGDPLEIPLVSRNLSAPVEQFTIELNPQKEKDRGELVLKWGTSALSAPFSAR